MPEADPPGVLHIVREWLPPSQTFVAAAVRCSGSNLVMAESLTGHPDTPARLLNPPIPVLRRFTAEFQRRLVLRRVLAQSRVRTVHVHFGYDLAQRVERLPRELRSRTVVSMHGHDSLGMTAADFAAARSVGRVLVPSRWFADYLREGHCLENLAHVPHGVDLDVFRPRPRTTLREGGRVLFVGRFVEKKGLRELLTAWDSVTKRLPHARLRLLGSGPLLQDTSLPPAVDIVGPDPNGQAQVAAAMEWADIVVSPSRTASNGDFETQLIVNLEAIASTRPLITTNHGPIPEFVDQGVTGLIVAEGSAAALAEALGDLLCDSGLRERLVSNCARDRGQFGLELFAERLRGVYLEVAHA